MSRRAVAGPCGRRRREARRARRDVRRGCDHDAGVAGGSRAVASAIGGRGGGISAGRRTLGRSHEHLGAGEELRARWEELDIERQHGILRGARARRGRSWPPRLEPFRPGPVSSGVEVLRSAATGSSARRSVTRGGSPCSCRLRSTARGPCGEVAWSRLLAVHRVGDPPQRPRSSSVTFSASDGRGRLGVRLWAGRRSSAGFAVELSLAPVAHGAGRGRAAIPLGELFLGARRASPQPVERPAAKGPAI